MGDFVKELGPTIRQFAKRLRHDYAAGISADPRRFKKRVVRLLRIHLPPFPGRPRKETITRALELHRQGTPWSEIYSQCIPNYGSLQWRERRVKIARLQNAVRARKRLDPKAAPRKNPKADISRQKNPAAFICASPIE
mgnify:CR=1 FL=1